MRYRLTILAAMILSLSSALPCSASAAGWPDNWVGPADSSFVHLRIGVLYYGAVLEDLPGDAVGASLLPYGGSAPDGTALPQNSTQWLQRLGTLSELVPASRQEEYTRTLAELQENARFYWRNSRFNCAITFENVETCLEPRLKSQLLKNDPPYNGPVEMERYTGLREKYDGLLHLVVLFRYNAEAGQLERVRGGGGWTWGCALKDKQTGAKLCGWSWWAVPPASHDCGSDWLFCHEFGHQLDSLFHESGHPEHWFNHLSRAEANTARFGEHFDCMSYILRRIPEADWQDLQWGEHLSYADADNDGVPDPSVWLATARLESDPDDGTADADSDGLSDREELLGMNGNIRGHGERLHPALQQVEPLVPDSDSDGLVDGADPLPWLPMPAFIPQTPDSARANWLSGPDDRQARLLASVPPCRLALAGNPAAQPLWFDLSYAQDNALLISVAWGEPGGTADSECRIVLDLENDGWFNGDDNYRFQLDASGISYAALNRANSYTEWPTEDKDAIDKTACGFTWLDSLPGYRYCAQLRLSKASFPAFQGKPGERIGINIGVSTAGTRWFYTFGEPNTQVPLELR